MGKIKSKGTENYSDNKWKQKKIFFCLNLEEATLNLSFYFILEFKMNAF